MSFHSAKVMTTVEGGMIFTDNEEYYEKIKIMRNQGEDPKEKYSHIMLGFNARMTDIQAAIGLVQFSKINSFLEKRRKIAEKYNKAFSAVKEITLIKETAFNKMAYFLYPIVVDNRDLINKKINEAGIDTRLCYHIPMYKHKMFKEYNNLFCENAEYISSRVINLPIHNCMTDEQVEYIIDSIREILL